MADRFGYGEIGLDINPCRGREDYDEPDGCKSNGGCGKPITNADRIRAMSDEELAEWLTALEIKAYSRIGYSGNEKRFKAQYIEWLKSPVEDGE